MVWTALLRWRGRPSVRLAGSPRLRGQRGPGGRRSWRGEAPCSLVRSEAFLSARDAQPPAGLDLRRARLVVLLAGPVGGGREFVRWKPLPVGGGHGVDYLGCHFLFGGDAEVHLPLPPPLPLRPGENPSPCGCAAAVLWRRHLLEGTALGMGMAGVSGEFGWFLVAARFICSVVAPGRSGVSPLPRCSSQSGGAVPSSLGERG